MNLPFLPQRRGDEIERATVKPVSLPDAKPEPPRQWTIPVSEGNTLAEFRSALERKYERRTWAIRIVNIVIATASSFTRIPELRMLFLTEPEIKSKSTMATTKKGWLQHKFEEKSTYVGAIVIIAVAVLTYFGLDVSAADLTKSVEAVVVALSALLVALAGAYDLFRTERTEND